MLSVVLVGRICNLWMLTKIIDVNKLFQVLLINLPNSFFRGEFHAMDCTDMVIGMANGDSSRIWDYYTRDRSTPRRDTYWGGSNDLTAAAGWERDGETIIMFRFVCLFYFYFHCLFVV